MKNINSRVPAVRSIESCLSAEFKFKLPKHEILSQQHTKPQHTSINQDIVDRITIIIFIALRKQCLATPRTLLGHRSMALFSSQAFTQSEAYEKFQNLTNQCNSETTANNKNPHHQHDKPPRFSNPFDTPRQSQSMPKRTTNLHIHKPTGTPKPPSI